VSIHRYPYTACPRRRRTRGYATIGRLLSRAATTGMADALRPAIRTAHRAGLPLRLTELNSVNCGGRPGVSDAFATALWAPGALFALLRASVDGINIHVRASAINAPFAITARGLTARPLLYGLILFARALGPSARLVRIESRHPRAAAVSAWAVRVGRDTLHVLLIDRGRRSLRVSLRVPGTGAAGVQRLLAPSPDSRTGVTLGGQSLAPDGSWRGRPVREQVAPRRGRYVVGVPRQSAALLTVRLSTDVTRRPGGT
ncbi:MAG: glycosyl hydrolase family 79 C-terminal domain-containing protein, partial [Solirubrobacteraceae bacterium]